ncbi:MAG: ATP-binding cassette domain-containing protein [Alphaproteobacteria bacterium]|nr:ATP-binding cassette domain-containing protein [Alphaproteobacteria bacterium]
MTHAADAGREPGNLQSSLIKIAPEAGELASNPVHTMHGRLEETFQCARDEKIDESSPAGACLKPLLLALGWSGEERHLVEALPHFDRVCEFEGLRAVLAALNFKTTNRAMPVADLKRSMLPCLLVQDGNVSIVMEILGDDRLMVFDGAKRDLTKIAARGGSADIFLIQDMDNKLSHAEIQKTGWFQTVLGKFKPTFLTLFGLSLAINLLAMTVPIYIMAVYQIAIGTKSLLTLASLLGGALLVLSAEVGLRIIRSRAIAYLGARVESLVTLNAFQQLLFLPVESTETASIATQVTRLKQYQNVKGLFTGSLAVAILDLPFISLFIVATFVIGGVLGFIPAALVLIYAALAALTIPMANKHMRRAGGAKTRMRNFLMETTSKHRSIRDTGAEDVWLKRFEGLAGHQMLTQFKAQNFNVSVQTLAGSLMIFAGATTVGVGCLLAMDGAVSIGALIGATTMVWRGLAPIQSAFLGLSRLGQSVDSLKQINQLMRLDLERQPGRHATIYRAFKGTISLFAVSMRYSGQTEPALSGISLKIKAGETIAITGNSGSGKSTLLKVISGLYRPQAGSILIDDLNTRQLDMGELRHAIGVVPQKPSFFYGTISQNIRLAHPTATDAEIEQALAMAGMLDQVKALDGGIEFRMMGSRETRFSEGFLKQLMLARAYVKRPSMYLLDEPGAQLDLAGDEAFVSAIKQQKGKATTVMATSRPSHMHLADRVFVLDRGQIVLEGPPAEVVPLILQQSNKPEPGLRVAG